MMKKYKTSSAGSVVLSIIAVVIFIIAILEINRSEIDPWLPWAYLLLLVFAIVDFKFGIYAGIQGSTFFEVKHFIYRRNIDVHDIDKIMYQPTWIFGKNMRSIYIVDRKDSKIKMTNGAYKLGTLAQIISDLKKQNTAIRLDDPAQELLKKYS